MLWSGFLGDKKRDINFRTIQIDAVCSVCLFLWGGGMKSCLGPIQEIMYFLGV